jgi:transcription initiation factor TFIIB
MLVKTEQSSSDSCPECGSKNVIIDNDTGEKICGGCGLVMADHLMNEGPEWRAYSQDERESRSRVGMPLSLSVHDMGLSTMISQVGKDAFGRTIPSKTIFQMLRLKKWHIRSTYQSGSDRNLNQAMAELSKLCDNIHIPKQVKEQAAFIYRKALDKGLVRGRCISEIVAASLYAACRETVTLRTLREFACVSTIDKKDLSRCYRLLLRELTIQVPIPRAQYRVPKIAAKVNIGEKTQQTAITLLQKAEKRHATAGKDPMGLAAGALYMACVMNEERRTQKEIAYAAGVTEVTIRSRCKGLKEALKLDI